MAYVKVKNKNGTTGKSAPAPYRTWLQFWEGEKGKKADKCEAKSCSGAADVGIDVPPPSTLIRHDGSRKSSSSSKV